MKPVRAFSRPSMASLGHLGLHKVIEGLHKVFKSRIKVLRPLTRCSGHDMMLKFHVHALTDRSCDGVALVACELTLVVDLGFGALTFIIV